MMVKQAPDGTQLKTERASAGPSAASSADKRPTVEEMRAVAKDMVKIAMERVEDMGDVPSPEKSQPDAAPAEPSKQDPPMRS